MARAGTRSPDGITVGSIGVMSAPSMREPQQRAEVSAQVIRERIGRR